ncbi:MAG: glycine zipper family protein, partial [Gammaproteobacteria bacterium]
MGEYPWSRAARQKPIPVTPKLPTRPNLITAPIPRQDRENFWALSWLEHNSKALTIPGSITLGATSNLFSPGNQALVTEVNDLYGQYKAGQITKGQYDYGRKIALHRLKNNLGPAEKWLFGNKTTHESIRIARRGGVPATAHIAKHASRIAKIAKYARNGGIVLTGVGLTASCIEIANTEERQEKNEILVETVGSTLTGAVGGALIGIFLVSN